MGARIPRGGGVTLVVRYLLAGVLLWAGVGKALDPQGFLLALKSFELVPTVAHHAVAILLPWVEIVVALALVGLPSYREAATHVAVGLAGVFVVAWAFAWWRGLSPDCACLAGWRLADVQAGAARSAIVLAVALLALRDVVPRPAEGRR